MRILPLMKGSSWSSWRKMTRPLASSTRFGSTGLKACSGGIGILIHGWAVATGLDVGWASVWDADWDVVRGLAGAVCWATALRVVRRIGSKAVVRRMVEGVFLRFISHLRRFVRLGFEVLPGWRHQELDVSVRRTQFVRWFDCCR